MSNIYFSFTFRSLKCNLPESTTQEHMQPAVGSHLQWNVTAVQATTSQTPALLRFPSSHRTSGHLQHRGRSGLSKETGVKGGLKACRQTGSISASVRSKFPRSSSLIKNTGNNLTFNSSRVDPPGSRPSWKNVWQTRWFWHTFVLKANYRSAVPSLRKIFRPNKNKSEFLFQNCFPQSVTDEENLFTMVAPQKRLDLKYKMLLRHITNIRVFYVILRYNMVVAVSFLYHLVP